MPYIKQQDREKFRLALEEIPSPANAGELNYLITMICHKYLTENAPINYQLFNDIMGALEGAKMELYRRKATPYEDIKIYQNGDV